MSRIVIIPRCQYGYNTDYFQMANRLAGKNIDVEMICFDQGFRKVEPPDNVHITYVVRKENNKAGNFVNYLVAAMKYVWKNKKTINWVVVSATIEFCGILPFAMKMFARDIRWIMDIRTCSVIPDERKRKVYDFLTLLSSYFFDRVTVISGLVAQRLKIKKYEVLPLGADCYVNLDEKEFDSKNLNFLYVGKFDDRRVEDLIGAFDSLCGKLSGDISRKLDIVGFGEREETNETIMNSLQNSVHRSNINYHGRKSHHEIKSLFQEATIGFSYVPVTEFFDVQPPTKTFEYIMNGIICVATNTKANSEIINDNNGILTEDNPESLLAGIEHVISNMSSFNSVKMSRTVTGSKWENIVDNFHVFLKKIDMKKG
ncbi:glycosyltransferase [Planococcus sp. APC 3906]|uniref:glycosyltransferase n=1 Tax=Planococcus sp. APC 3906 TaxID=3035194 RepID=UPI0025B428C5|nr:glycosyltransferase [Planococcus sp. APC 3906]MDN3450107.1 glycosyltransferase [Planococcus sp. APC 3906]